LRECGKGTGTRNITKDDPKSPRRAGGARILASFPTGKRIGGESDRGGECRALARAAHREWYRELSQPCVAAGLIEPGALAGYRNIPVYLRTSRYVPPRWEAVRDAMPVLFDLLEREVKPSGARRARSLAVRLYPFLSGRQRADGRFLMNVMLASGGYPWTVIGSRIAMLIWERWTAPASTWI